MGAVSRPVLLVAVLGVACGPAWGADGADRIAAALAARGVSAAALGLIGNAVAHRALPEPPAAGKGTQRYLDDPVAALAVADALDLPAASSPPPTLDWAPPADLPEPVRDFVARLVAAAADLTVHVAAMVPGPCCERAALIAAAAAYGGDAAVERLVREVDRAALDRAAAAAMGVRALVLGAFAGVAHDAAGALLSGHELADALALIPGRRFSSPVGTVVIAPAASTVHEAPAAIVIDVGGNDSYRLDRLGAEGTLVIVDLAGNDTYAGDDTAVRAARVLIDFAGDDLRESDGGGQGAAIGGVSVLHDGAGADRYRARVFAQGAAVAGFGALIDEAGDDRYQIGARGQGFGGPVGFGALVDRDGKDSYRAEGGLADPFGEPGGGLSFAQGAAAGLGGRLAGGIGLLRDLAGDDRYEAEKYAQGVGADRGLGVLDERAGDDSLVATHYGQGFGVRAGIGLVRERDGFDGYWLAEGAGQGAGLDFGIGALVDDAGGDRYQARRFAQGASRRGGLGVLADDAGGDVYALDLPGDGWGRGRGLPALPALAFLIDDGESDALMLGGAPLLDRSPVALAGPLAGRAPGLDAEPAPACPAPGEGAGAYHDGDPVGAWLAQAPLLARGDDAGAELSARLWASLPASVPALLHEVPTGEPLLAAKLETLLRCYLIAGDPLAAAEARGWLIEAVKGGTGHAAAALAALAAAPPDAASALSVAAVAAGAPDCATRAGAIDLVAAVAARDPTAADNVAAYALGAAGDRCWQAAGAALELWRAVRGPEEPLPVAVAELLPAALRSNPAAAGAPEPEE